MTRILLCLLVALAALPALPQGAIEKWADRILDKQQAAWMKESLDTLASHPDAAKRLEAAKWLSSQTDPAAIAALANALASDKDARVREASARGLWMDGQKAAAAKPQLLKALDDPDPNVVAQSAGALQATGMKEAELAAARKRVLASPDATVSSRFLVARNLVGYESPEKLVEAMIAYLERNAANRTNLALVEQALERLVKRTKDRALIAPLRDALITTKDGAVTLIRTLGFFDPRPDDWTAILLEQLDSPQPRVRSAALGQLRYVKREKDVAVWAPRVAGLLRDPEAAVRSDALWALGNAAGLAAAHVDAVVDATRDPDKSVRRSAARALGEMGEDTQAIPAATKARVQSAARPVLTAAMEKDEDSDVRDEAKGALRKLGRGEAIAAARSDATGNDAAGMATLRARKVSFEETSFFSALQQVDVELVAAFLDAGMSPKTVFPGLGPPLRVVFFAGSACAPNQRPTKPATIAITKLLLERGADVNGADANGNTPLSEAASKGCDRELMRMLIRAGAKVDAKNAAGLTPFEIGLWTGSDGLEELIAAGYRMPADKAKAFADGYKDRPAALALIRKATRK